MKLDQYQRWTLINELMILEKMYPDQAEHFRLKRRVFQDGHANLYSHALSEDLREGLSEEAYRETEDILWMFLNLQQACEALLPGHGIKLDLLQFKGFHNRVEWCRNSYAIYVLKTQDRFADLEYGTASQPMLPRYRRMLEAWEKCSEQSTVDDLRSIQEAAIDTNVRSINSGHQRRVSQLM